MAWSAERGPTRRAVVVGGAATIASCAVPRGGGRVIHRDAFTAGLRQWVVEAERPGRVTAQGGTLDIVTPAGMTLWFRPVLEGAVAIDYTVTPVAAGGLLDTISDVNCFWMASDPRAPGGDVLARPRSGAFADYDGLLTYYAGIGGNRNTTTRMRRYVGQRDNRPLLPQHDLSARDALLTPGRPIHIRLVADGRRITVERDAATLFALDDAAPYTRGRFALRTTQSHLRVTDFRVVRLPA